MTVSLVLSNDLNDLDLIKNSITSGVVVLQESATNADVLAIDGLTRLGLMFHNENKCSVPFFRTKVVKTPNTPKAKAVKTPKAKADKTPKAKETKVSTKSDLQSKLRLFSQDLVDLAKQLVVKNGSLVLDIISCDMNTEEFVKEVTLFAGLTGASVEYSTNQTGNGNNADWVLESNSENLINLYYTENILKWNHTLNYNSSNNIYRTSADVLNFFNVTNMINGAGALTYHHGTYKLTKDVSIDVYDGGEPTHIMLNEGEVFDGNDYTMTYITNNSRGLFVINGNQGSTKTTIKNLNVTSDGDAKIRFNGGGIVRNQQSNFTIKNCKNLGFYMYGNNENGGIVGGSCNNFVVEHCTNSVDVYDDYCGGIVGAYCTDFEVKKCKNLYDSNNDNYIYYYCGGIVGYNCSKFKVSHCTNNVAINDTNTSGGIVGPECFDFEVEDCSNTGDLTLNDTNFCSGIVAPYCNDFKVKDCENYSNIPDYSGGIVGSYCHSFEVEKCRNNGISIGDESGGIISENCSNFKINKCKNFAEVSGDYAGGIVGDQTGHNDDNGDGPDYYVKIYNCTNHGDVTGQYAGGITGSQLGYVDGDNNNTTNMEIRIFHCFNKGSVTASMSAGGICGSDLGYVDYQNGESTTIKIEKSQTYSGSLIGPNVIYNNLSSPVPTRLIIKESYTHDSLPLIDDTTTPIPDSSCSFDTRTAVYIKKNGKKINLITHPTYVAKH